MTGSDAASRKLNALLKKLRTQHAPPAPPGQPATTPAPTEEVPDQSDSAIHQLVFSTLLWEASTAQAKATFRRLRECVVDYNELRVCIPDEIATMLGERYPLAGERAMRLRSLLNDVFNRHHAVTLAPLKDLGKREARHLMESLEGATPFIAARVCLLEAQTHSVPCDERLRDLLAAQGVLAEGTPVEDATGWLERHVKHEECLETHRLLQAWSDEHGTSPRREPRRVEVVRPSENGDAKPERKAKTKQKGPRTDGPKKAPKAKPRAGS